MALKGFEGRKEQSGPTVHVSVRQPKDDYSVGRGAGRRNPVERFDGRILVLGGIAALIVAAALIRKPRDIGALNTRGGIGDVARFEIDPDNADRVKAVVAKFLDRARRDSNLRGYVQDIIQQNGLDTRNQRQLAATLHGWVNGPDFPVKADPKGFESIVSPEELMIRYLNGSVAQLAGLDCDDKALFMSSVFYHAGITSQVCLLDTDGDGSMDHAGTYAQIDGKWVFAETVVPGKEFGWKPRSYGEDCIVS